MFGGTGGGAGIGGAEPGGCATGRGGGSGGRGAQDAEGGELLDHDRTGTDKLLIFLLLLLDLILLQWLRRIVLVIIGNIALSPAPCFNHGNCSDTVHA